MISTQVSWPVRRRWVSLVFLVVSVWLLWGVLGHYGLLPLSGGVARVVVYPILEELTFRGWLQTHLLAHPSFRRKRLFFTWANLWTSIVFSLVHFWVRGFPLVLSVFFPSVLFGYCRDKYGSVIPGTFLHVVFNGVYFAVVGS